MAPKKKVAGLIKLQIQAGAANPAPPIGPALGQHGVNIMEFCKAYNAATESQRGNVIPVEITVYEDRSFTFVTKTPPAAELIKKAADMAKGSAAFVPAFDALAAEGFSGGLGSFEPPAFDVGALAAPLAFAVSWPTCMAGAILPALRTRRVAPVDFLRKTGADTGRSRAGTAARRVLSGLLLGLSLAILPLGALLGGNGVGAIVNGIVSAGILATLAVFAAGVEGVRLATRTAGLIPRTLGDAVGHLAALIFFSRSNAE